MRIKCYSGLTLNEAELHARLPGAELAAPIARGELLRDIRKQCNVVLIVDGKFHHSMSVSPSDILDALRAGIRVYGSSSMGALRACELESYGMIGHGKVFELVKSHRAFEDDFLGQVFAPDNPTGAHLAFIDVYFNCETLHRKGEMSTEAFRTVTRLYAGLHYSERTPAALLRLCRSAFKGDERLLALVERATRKMGSQKKRDAHGLLGLVKRELASIERLNRRVTRSLAPHARARRL